jgi:two-component system chemotaxis response regulator CheB
MSFSVFAIRGGAVIGRRRIKVLIVDDSAIVRKLLTEALADEDDLEVVGTAPDPFVARDKIFSLRPDVITLDLEMPRMNGLTFLKRLMHYHPMPVIVISSVVESSCQAALDALRLGAVEVLPKPGGPYSVGELRLALPAKIRAAAAARLPQAQGQASAQPPQPHAPATTRPAFGEGFEDRSSHAAVVIAIGASTGGTEAIQRVLTQLPADCPGIVITQHIPPVFSRTFANRMNEICPMEVKEACDGDTVGPGKALVAPGNFHMLLRKGAGSYHVTVREGPLVCYQRPSVDVMLTSVAAVAGAFGVGVLLTGMGSDGAQGLLRMRSAGARTIAQDEESCVVFGMPKEAIRLGGAARIVPLSKMASAIFSDARSAASNLREPSSQPLT